MLLHGCWVTGIKIQETSKVFINKYIKNSSCRNNTHNQAQIYFSTSISKQKYFYRRWRHSQRYDVGDIPSVNVLEVSVHHGRLMLDFRFVRTGARDAQMLGGVIHGFWGTLLWNVLSIYTACVLVAALLAFLHGPHEAEPTLAR